MAIPATALGLDLAGPGTDNLDALFVEILFFEGSGGPSLLGGPPPPPPPPPPGGGAFGIVLFSVDKDSAVIGTSTIDILGAPAVIRPGDVLAPPIGGGPPIVVVRAEDLGLIGGTAAGLDGTLSTDDDWGDGDELDALDVVLGHGLISSRTELFPYSD